MSLEPSKPVWKSKTVWTNLVTVAAALVGVIPPDEISALVIALVNILLRLFTRKAVTLDDPAAGRP